MSRDLEGTARRAFSAILGQFPHLSSAEKDDPNVEISIVVPVQDGLKHEVWLALQNSDELHFVVGHFWLEWFPCTDSARVESYVNAVSGFLAGRNRIVEHYRGPFCFKAQLQQPTNGSWETIGTWSRLRWPSLRKTTFKQLVNA